MIAWHLARAAKLEPDPARQAAAFEATIDASEHAALRGAIAQAQQLLEHAAELAPSGEQRVTSLKRASELAMSRLRGDEGYRLLLAAGEVAEELGMAREAAELYAWGVEVGSRMAGISGGPPSSQLAEVLARAERLAPSPDPGLKAEILLDHAWIQWATSEKGYLDESFTERVVEGLALAREVGDPLLLSNALDAASSTSWWEGRFREAAAQNRERLDVLARTPASPAVAAERTDALYMLTQSLIRAGRLREALEWDEINAREIAESAPHIAWAHSIPALYMLGEWEAALERGATMRANWISEGRPPFAPFSPCMAAVGAIVGIRGDEPAYRDWIEAARGVAADTQQVVGVSLMAADVAVHRGDLEGAIALLDGLTPNFWWRDTLLARRAEVLALGGHPGAREALEAATANETDDPLSTAVQLRTRAVLDGDEKPMREALEIFERTECVYAAAYTRWLLGGEERAAASEAFTRLGALEPV